MSDVNVVQKENQMYWEGTVEITDKGKEFKGLLRLEAVGTAYVITYMKEEGKAPKRHIAGLVSKGDEGMGIFFTVFEELADESEEDTRYAVRCLDELESMQWRIPLEDLAELNYIEVGKD